VRRLAWALAAGLAMLALYRPAFISCFNSDYCTAIGEMKTVTLADGSRLTLNTESALKVEFNEQLRHVQLLRGEVFFDVTPNAQRPFVVDANHSQTRVKGTRFLVREQTHFDSVTVASGIVEVSHKGGNPTLLRENDQIHIDDNHIDTPYAVSGSLAAAWLKGSMLFDNVPLTEVVAEISRYQRGTVLFKRDSLKTLKVSGRFSVSNIDKAWESLAQTLPIHIYRITPWLIVIA
jgi:transmembrane sensor